MLMPNWLDSLLYSHIRAYRRHKFRRSRVRAELMQPVPSSRPPIARLDDWLDRPAILTDHARRQAFMRGHPSLVEKLTDEATMQGMTATRARAIDSWPREWWCEHCPQYGHCGVCGQDHVSGGAA